MKKFDVCVLGAGASGCVCAILLAKKGLKVALIEQNSTPATKLLVTGNGRCNLTNNNMSSAFYNQNIDLFLNRFSSKDTIIMFKNFGLECYCDNEGRYYPLSNTAKSVAGTLQFQLEKNKVSVLCDKQILSVEKENENFCVNCVEEKIYSAKVVFATGNKLPNNVLNALDIETKKLYPSLVALKVKEDTKRLDGIRVSDVEVTTELNGACRKDFGEILFKKNGLSGICIFNASTIFARNCCYFGKISINLLPKFNKTEIFDMICEKVSIFTNVDKLLMGMFNSEICREILHRANLNIESCKDLKKQDIKKIVFIIQNFTFSVCDCYDNNQVFSGGVELNCLTSSLMSKKQNGIYFCGEICDIDGECGGYNLQWAWTSANIVSEDIQNTNKLNS